MTAEQLLSTGTRSVVWAYSFSITLCVSVCDENASKDKRKQRRQKEGALSVAQERWVCSDSGCGFLAQSKAGLVNHTSLKHTTMAQHKLRCEYCGRHFKVQGMIMHQRYCASKGNG